MVLTSVMSLVNSLWISERLGSLRGPHVARIREFLDELFSIIFLISTRCNQCLDIIEDSADSASGSRAKMSSHKSPETANSNLHPSTHGGSEASLESCFETRFVCLVSY